MVVEAAAGHQVSTLQPTLGAVAPGGQVLYFGGPDDPVYPLDTITFLRKNLTMRSGVTLERRRLLADAGTYLAEHRGLRQATSPTSTRRRRGGGLQRRDHPPARAAEDRRRHEVTALVPTRPTRVLAGERGGRRPRQPPSEPPGGERLRSGLRLLVPALTAATSAPRR